MTARKEKKLKAIIDATVFKNLVNNAKAFVKRDSMYINKMLTYIFVEVDAYNKEIKVIALDGHRVSMETAQIIEADESFKCFIRPNIPKITKNDLFVELELNMNDGKCFVTVSESIVGYKQPQGEYFDYKKFIRDVENQEAKASVLVNASLLKEALNSVKTQGNVVDYVKIEIREKHEPIVIRYGKKRDRSNLKLVLPVSGD